MTPRRGVARIAPRVHEHRMRGDRGNRRFDRVFPEPIGRINCSSATLDDDEFTLRNRILDELWADGQTDVLLEIKKGRRCQVSWGEIKHARKLGRLTSATLMADIKLRRRLWDRARGGTTIKGAVSRAIDAMDCAESTKDRYRLGWRHLEALTTELLPTDTARVRHLARIPFNRIMRRWDTAAANKNRVRSAVSATLTQLLGDKFHPFRRQIIHPKHWKPARELAEPKEITVDEFWTLMAAMPSELVDAYVTLAASGMRVGEFLAADTTLQARRHRIKARGKTGWRYYAVAPSLWEHAERAIPCRIAKRRSEKPPKRLQDDPRYKRLYRELVAAGEAMDPPLAVSPHYLRHLYVQLGVDTVGETRTQHAVGHATPRMTQDYARRKDQSAVAQAIADALVKPITPKSTARRKRA